MTKADMERKIETLRNYIDQLENENQQLHNDIEWLEESLKYLGEKLDNLEAADIIIKDRDYFVFMMKSYGIVWDSKINDALNRYLQFNND